ncbi:MAG: carbonic anhydrase, partial [Myxococcota bacterium]
MNEDTSAEFLEEFEEKPENGLKGLKHFRYDFMAGFVVSLVSLPLSSGIAIASGAPPIYGIISSVIAGLIFPFVGGSFVTIAGPAAGLAPALLAIMAALGGAGDADHVGAGYHMLLAVICIVGVAQVIMARLKLARYAGIFPASVVEGMLGAIGVLILVKALPLFFGYLEPVHAHGFFAYVAEIPHWFQSGDLNATLIGIAGLAAMLAAISRPARRLRLFQVVPPHIFAVLIGVAATIVLNIREGSPLFLIQVPTNPLDGISFPAFGQLFSSPELWQAAAIGIVTLTLIDGVESLATAQAIDRIDPFARRSEPNRVLRAMG